MGTTAILAAGDLVDGKYRIESLLGEGGMGAVYRATHLGTTRTVAIKVIQPRLSNRPEFVERFRREAEAAGRLRHPNVVDVTDFGFARVAGGTVAYLVMEFLERVHTRPATDASEPHPHGRRRDASNISNVMADAVVRRRDWVVPQADTCATR